MDYIDSKYIRIISSHLDKFKSVGPNVYNFRCPICGDSHKDKTKARGYLFDKGDKVLYHCHNCGSPDVRSLQKLIEFLSIDTYKEYRYERFGAKYTQYKAPEVDDEEFKTDTSRFKQKVESTESILSVCQKLSELPDDHKARKYLKDERQMYDEEIDKMYYLKDINLLTNQLEKYKEKKFFRYDCILIPFADFEGIINCIQLRILDKKSELRYLTLYLNEDKSKAIYGLDHIDVEKTTYMCEGPFNSSFIENGIACAGATQSSKLNYIKDYVKDLVLVFDPDYRTNPHVRAPMEKAIRDGYKVVIYDEVFGSDDDINDVVIRNKWTRSQLMDYLKSRTFQGLQAKLKLSEYTKPKKESVDFNKKRSSLMDKLERTIRR